MYIRCNLKKGSDDATDFEQNYKDKVVVISKMIMGAGIVFIKSVDWDTFKSSIDGNSTTWDMVKLREGVHNYELWLDE